MRVLVTAGWLGGAGGAERALYSVARALSGEDVTVAVRSVVGGPLARLPESTRVWTPRSLRTREFSQAHPPVRRLLAGPLRSILNQTSPHFDAHLHYWHGPNLSRTTRAAVRILIPAGNDPSQTNFPSDVIAYESPPPEGHSHLNPSSVLPPPWFPPAERCEPIAGLPGEFALTVFNPYGAIKGADELIEAAESSPMPIVWCRSNATMQSTVPDALSRHSRIVQVIDPTPEQLRFLYENCYTYLCFSRSEGFGWAIADALALSPRVISRRVGVLRLPDVRTEGVILQESMRSLPWEQLASEHHQPTGVLQVASPDDFAVRLRQIVRGHAA